MAQEQFGNVEQVRDRNGDPARPASDEELHNVNDAVGNAPAGTWSTTDVSVSGATSPPSNAVRDGFSVVIQASNQNDDLVLVDGIELKGGQSIALPWGDTSDPTLDVASGTQSVTIGWFDA